ncbi:hypothetical protein EV137_6633 [Kribbella pratensis]|uniref:Uncharacterized protein n=1 Tax=Kribbella pratensis TaxID=2512112 RepID=A0ABY2F635_9ACTN|nr:hypothetical protein [Kribbella pratensis]TDW83831.1 hypothetical protein EV137_6633 [Kribbella pratensis]
MLVLGSPLGWLLNALSFLPLWVRPWALSLLVLVAVWLLFFRSGPKRLAVLGLRLVLLLGVVVLTIPLAVEYTNTRRRRAAGKSPGQAGAAVSEVAEAVSLNLAGADQRLAKTEYSNRSWPRKTMALLAGAGILSWIVFAASPALAAPTAFGGKAYGWYRDFENWAGAGSTRIVVPDKEAVPTLVGRKTDVILSTSPAHHGEIARVSPVGQEKRAVQILLDRSGNAVIHVTPANAATYMRGGTYLVQAKDLRVLVRLQ